MKYISVVDRRLLFAFCTSILLAGCSIHDDLDPCPGYKLTLKVVNAEGDDITEAVPGDVPNASLFIFDEKGNYLETRALDQDFIAGRREIVLDGYSADAKLTVVAWGNIDDADKTTVTKSLKTAVDLKVTINRTADPEDASKTDMATSADDLYFGSLEVIRASIGDGITVNDTIVIRPRTGEIHIETEGLQYAINARTLKADDPMCNFYLNRTLDSYNYKGETIGDSVYYNPAGDWGTSTIGKEWYTPKNHRLCPGEKMDVALNLNKQLLGRKESDQIDDPITVEPGQLKYVLIQFGEDGLISGVKVSVRPWGVVKEEHEL